MTTPTALSHLAGILNGLSIEWALAGALAANRYRGTPRMTSDIDLLLTETGGGLDDLEKALREDGWSVRRADIEGSLLRLKHEDFGIADLLIAGTDYQRQAVARAVTETVGDLAVHVLTAEDLIIHKLIAGRFQDLADVQAILETGVQLDRRLIDHWIDYWDVRERWERVQQAARR